MFGSGWKTKGKFCAAAGRAEAARGQTSDRQKEKKRQKKKGRTGQEQEKAMRKLNSINKQVLSLSLRSDRCLIAFIHAQLTRTACGDVSTASLVCMVHVHCLLASARLVSCRNSIRVCGVLLYSSESTSRRGEEAQQPPPLCRRSHRRSRSRSVALSLRRRPLIVRSDPAVCVVLCPCRTERC